MYCADSYSSADARPLLEIMSDPSTRSSVRSVRLTLVGSVFVQALMLFGRVQIFANA